MYKEIGSEFWNEEVKKEDKRFFLSGRTALDFIIKNILFEYPCVNSVLLPSYCCHTMIEPFVRNGIQVRFYDVFYDGVGLKIEIPEPKKNEIFYLMKYFGYSHKKIIEESYIRSKWELIIEDKTHSLFSRDRDEISVEYRYASCRKWCALSGLGWAIKKNGEFKLRSFDKLHEPYCKMRNQAFEMKKEYMLNQADNKDIFLSMFSDAEELLEQDYVGYTPDIKAIQDYYSLNQIEIVEKRQRNARYLMKELRELSTVKLLFDEMMEEDVPLFVPILVGGERGKLRNYLIENTIYLPIHWPLSNDHMDLSNKALCLYQQELSLVCDQRYELEDMERMVYFIKKFYS